MLILIKISRDILLIKKTLLFLCFKRNLITLMLEKENCQVKPGQKIHFYIPNTIFKSEISLPGYTFYRKIKNEPKSKFGKKLTEITI